MPLCNASFNNHFINAFHKYGLVDAVNIGKFDFQ